MGSHHRCELTVAGESCFFVEGAGLLTDVASPEPAAQFSAVLGRDGSRHLGKVGKAAPRLDFPRGEEGLRGAGLDAEIALHRT